MATFGTIATLVGCIWFIAKGIPSFVNFVESETEKSEGIKHRNQHMDYPIRRRNEHSQYRTIKRRPRYRDEYEDDEWEEEW